MVMLSVKLIILTSVRIVTASHHRLAARRCQAPRPCLTQPTHTWSQRTTSVMSQELKVQWSQRSNLFSLNKQSKQVSSARRSERIGIGSAKLLTFPKTQICLRLMIHTCSLQTKKQINPSRASRLPLSSTTQSKHWTMNSKVFVNSVTNFASYSSRKNAKYPSSACPSTD